MIDLFEDVRSAVCSHGRLAPRRRQIGIAALDRPRFSFTFALFSFCAIGVLSCRTVPAPLIRPARPPMSDSARAVASPTRWNTAAAIDSLVSSMPLEEKVSQMLIVRAYGQYFSTDSDPSERLVRLVSQRRVGGLMMAQGDVMEEAVLLNRLQRIARIPLLVAADFEHGLGGRVRRGTFFPDAMTVGATRRPDLAYRMGKTTAEEARAIGIHQIYAPVADINTNPLNPVINTRAFSDDPELVRDMVTAFLRGVGDGGGIATVKHFPGHGGTGTDSHVGLPVVTASRSRLDSVELSSFEAAITLGVPSVMVGHLAVPSLDSLDRPASLSPLVIGDILRKDLGFAGLVVTDALEMQGVRRKGGTGRYSSGEAAVLAVKAGADLLLVLPDEDAAVNAIVHAVGAGEISEDRINASLKRILVCKQSLGLDGERLVDIDAIAGRVATRLNRGLAREIAREGITVLRNDGSVLPLPMNGRQRIAVVLLSDIEDNRIEVARPGSAATSEPYGAFFLQELRRRSLRAEPIRLSPASSREDLDAAEARVRNSDIALFCLFARPRSASDRIALPDFARQFVTDIGSCRTPLIACIFGNPYLAGSIPGAEAVMCAYGDNEAVSEASVEALFGEIPVSGKLPVTIPESYAFGAGIEIPQSQLRREEAGQAGIDETKLAHVDELVQQAIADSAFPGAQVVIIKDGMILYEKCFGTETYEKGSREIEASTLFDLASLTKGVATTAALMRLYDQKKIDLDDPVGKYLPAFGQGEKQAVTIRQLLLHRGGLPPFRLLWKACPDSAAAMDTVLATPLVAMPGDTTIYSDLGMMVLGKVVEKAAGVPLDVYVRREFYVPLHMANTMFRPDSALADRTAPTEFDPVWRKKLVQGSVHDENAAYLGGVAGHAGLFSTASDLAIFMQMLLNRGTYGGRRYISEGTIYEFLVRKAPGQERWLGWDRKSGANPSAGSLFSPSSFGHTGFTGTSIWADPSRNLAVIFLTNRIYPNRANMRLLRVRPLLHDAVVRAVDPPQEKK